MIRDHQPDRRARRVEDETADLRHSHPQPKSQPLTRKIRFGDSKIPFVLREFYSAPVWHQTNLERVQLPPKRKWHDPSIWDKDLGISCFTEKSHKLTQNDQNNNISQKNKIPIEAVEVCWFKNKYICFLGSVAFSSLSRRNLWAFPLPARKTGNCSLNRPVKSSDKLIIS